MSLNHMSHWHYEHIPERGPADQFRVADADDDVVTSFATEDEARAFVRARTMRRCPAPIPPGNTEARTPDRRNAIGVVAAIGFDHFPKQGDYKGRRVRVCFNYDASHEIMGTVIRDDTEEPGHMIIQLDDGRVVLSTECMWSPLPAKTH